MYVRDCLCAGDFLTVVPVGLELTVKYNPRGLICEITRGYGSDKDDLTGKLLGSVVKNNTIPSKISVQGGTTYIEGVLYTSDMLYDDGDLPEIVSDKLVNAYLDNPSKFNFFAGNVDSLATVFRGASPIRNWLAMSGFNVLPGWLIPSPITRDAFIKLVNTDMYNFKFPLIASYMIYRVNETLHVRTGIKQFKASRVVKYLDDNGYLKAKIYNNNSQVKACVNYSDIVNFDIQVNSIVVLDKYGNIIYSEHTDNKKREKRSNRVNCPVCGKPYVVPVSDEVSCPDAQCMSKLYPEMCRFLSVFNLTELDKFDYDKHVSSGKLTCIPDVLELEPYCNASIKCTLVDILNAIVPTSVVPDRSIFALIANGCNNNVNAFQYYIHHPDMIIEDLNINNLYSKQLVEWLSDVCNALNIDALLDNPIITIVESNKRFDGPPIFRGKTILITGNFVHGSIEDIKAILQSYSASVVTVYSDEVDCIVTGDTLEDINGVYVRNARNSHKPIYSESAFFLEYEIDDDLAQNL